MGALVLQAAARTDTGPVRPHNEDAVFASERMVAVADGVGGAAAGEVASAAVINAMVALDKRLLTEPLPSALAQAVREGNEAVAFISSCRPQTAGMSTTLTAVAVDERYVVASIGDSRAYLLRDGALTQLTRDDSLVQELIDAGHLDPAGARTHPQRNVVLAALDGDPARQAGIGGTEAHAGDRVLVCSDGLSDVVDDAALRDALDAEPDRGRCAERLIALALAAGARDNVSAIVADVVEAPGGRSAWD